MLSHHQEVAKSAKGFWWQRCWTIQPCRTASPPAPKQPWCSQLTPASSRTGQGTAPLLLQARNLCRTAQPAHHSMRQHWDRGTGGQKERHIHRALLAQGIAATQIPSSEQPAPGGPQHSKQEGRPPLRKPGPALLSLLIPETELLLRHVVIKGVALLAAADAAFVGRNLACSITTLAVFEHARVPLDAQ